MPKQFAYLLALAAGLGLGATGGYLRAPAPTKTAAPIEQASLPAPPAQGSAAPLGEGLAQAAGGPAGRALDGALAGTEDGNRRIASNVQAALGESGLGELGLENTPAGPWMSELAELLSSGRLEPQLTAQADESDPEFGAALVLLDLYRQVGDLTAALDVLERHQDLGHKRWSLVGRDLTKAGELGLASRALTEAINLLPPETKWGAPLTRYISQLAAVDPAGALSRAEAFIQGDTTPAQDLLLAQLMSQAGQGAAARARAIELLELDQDPVAALAILADEDPELAEAEIRRRLDGEDAPDELETQLLDLLVEGGRHEDALALMDERAADGGQDPSLLRHALQALPAHLVETRLDAWLEDSSDSVAARHIVGGHFAHSDPARAFDFYASGFEEAFDQSRGSLNPIPDEILLHDPSRAMATLSGAAARAGSNDEIWGDLGDHYWRMGEAHLAEEAWQRAAELDPDDSEWFGNLQDLALNQSPVGSVPIPNTQN